MKKCKGCEQELPLSKFGPADGNASGVNNLCRACNTKRVLEYYRKNKEKRLAYQREYYYKRRGNKVNTHVAKEVPGKACSSCKAVGGFYTKDKSAKDGFNRQCTICVNSKAKARREAKKAK